MEKFTAFLMICSSVETLKYVGFNDLFSCGHIVAYNCALTTSGIHVEIFSKGAVESGSSLIYLECLSGEGTSTRENFCNNQQLATFCNTCILDNREGGGIGKLHGSAKVLSQCCSQLIF